MDINHFKSRLIKDGIASIKRHETRPERIEGGVAGFEMCRSLNSLTDFQECLRSRHTEERFLATAAEQWPIKYRQYCYATIQIEFVYERMLVIWAQEGSYTGTLSGRAILHTADILSRGTIQ